MAASFTIAGRNNGFSMAEANEVTLTSVSAYRKAMAELAAMDTMDIWYARLSEDELMTAIKAAERAQTGKAQKKEAKKSAQKIAAKIAAAKAHTRDSLQALSKLAEVVDGKHRIVSQPPIVVPFREIDFSAYGVDPEQLERYIHAEFRAYRATLQSDRRHLLEKFELVDVARKVVGVGSVGTRAFIALLQGRDEEDPLFLQVKEATTSVLEDHLPKSRHQPGSRVVHGQRMMQAANIYLGWTKGVQADRYLYWRELRDIRLGRGRGDDPVRTRLLWAPVRVDARARARPLGRPRLDCRLPRQERCVRAVAHRLLSALCG